MENKSMNMLREKLKMVESKRQLSPEDENVLFELAKGYYPQKEDLEKCTKLLRESNNTRLVESVFDRLENDLTSTFISQFSAVDFVYALNDKRLNKKFVEYVISTLNSDSTEEAKKNAIKITLYTKDKKLTQKMFASIPIEKVPVFYLLSIIEKEHLELALDQFLQPKYDFLPLLSLLSLNILSKEQANKIINSITYDGLTKYAGKSIAYFHRVQYKFLPSLAKKMVEVGWYNFDMQAHAISLNFIVLLLLNMEDKEEKKLETLNKNSDYAYGVINPSNEDSYTRFTSTVYFIGLEKQLQIPHKEKNVSSFVIR